MVIYESAKAGAHGASKVGVQAMCDYSLATIKSRPAKVGDKLITTDFGTGTRGFAAEDDHSTAVCVTPGTELAFASDLRGRLTGFFGWKRKNIPYRTAIFRQINKTTERVHHDVLEFPDGQTELLTLLEEGQRATVLQLPAAPKTEAEQDAQKRVAFV
jgi:hypothetical protein